MGLITGAQQEPVSAARPRFMDCCTQANAAVPTRRKADLFGSLPYVLRFGDEHVARRRQAGALHLGTRTVLVAGSVHRMRRVARQAQLLCQPGHERHSHFAEGADPVNLPNVLHAGARPASSTAERQLVCTAVRTGLQVSCSASMHLLNLVDGCQAAVKDGVCI